MDLRTFEKSSELEEDKGVRRPLRGVSPHEWNHHKFYPFAFYTVVAQPKPAYLVREQQPNNDGFKHKID